MRTFAIVFSFILLLGACSPDSQVAQANPDVKPTESAAEVQTAASLAYQSEKVKKPAQVASAANTAGTDKKAAEVHPKASSSASEQVKKPEAAAAASSAQVYVAGTHFDVLKTPVATITPGKIEVTEVFWYGCGHCFSFEPILNAWSKSLAKDVELVKSPAIWRENMEAHARIFYTAKALGVFEEAHVKVFEAMHNKRMALTSEKEIREFFKQFGVEPGKFDSIYNSFAVNSQVQQAGSRARSFMITGTPEIVVDGRFRVTAGKAGGQKQMLQVVDFLLTQIRNKNI